MRLNTSALDLPLRGHDAYAFSDRLLVVADGVGSWVDRGVDPSIWSHLLVSEIVMHDGYPATQQQLMATLTQSVARCRAPGSSTLTLVVIHPSESHALAYNLGDSRWWHIRDGSVLSRSRDRMHAPNFPYQIGRNPDLSISHDNVSDGHVRTLDIRIGDRLVLASDGLIKLMDSQELATLVSDEEPAVAVGLLDEILSDLRTSSDYALRDDISVIVAEVVE